MVIDFGAAETVLPNKWFLDYATKPSAWSMNGQHYTAANGDPISNEGEKVLLVSDKNGQNIRKMQFQVCDVGKALGSVMEIVKNGNTVVYDDWGSYIENKGTGERMWLKEHDGVYVLDALVALASEAKKRMAAADQDFLRQVAGR